MLSSQPAAALLGSGEAEPEPGVPVDVALDGAL